MLFVVDELVRRGFVHDGALAHDVGVVGHAHGHAEVLLHQQDRLPGRLEPLDDPEDLVDDHRRQTLRRLVEEQQVGVGHERAGDREHLLLAAAQEVALVLAPLGQLGEDLEHLLERPGVGLAAASARPSSGSRPPTATEDHPPLRDEPDAQPRDLVGGRPTVPGR